MRQVEERQFTTHDGTSLFYRYWPATGARAERAIVLFHRGHEHSGRLQHVVDGLGLDEFPMFAWDARGHGRSPGPRGDSPSFAASVKDVDAFIHHVAAEYRIRVEDIAVIAQSVGAVYVATWAHDYAPPVRCLVLAAPAFKVKLYVPFARRGLELRQRLSGNFFVNSYVKARFLTHDPERIRSYESDPLITRAISVRILLALYDAGERVVADARAIQLPVQLLISGADWVVHQQPQFEFFERLGSVIKERHVLPGFYHDTLGEKDRHLALEKIREFIGRMFATAPEVPSLLQADRRGFTRDEEARLSAPLPALSLQGLRFRALRLSMRTLGTLSEGIQLGIRTGFDSGSTLDYVYRNLAAGRTALGRMIDRNYLDSIGWRGIRVRKENLERAIATAARRLTAQGLPVRIADIAAGHGRYVLEAVEALTVTPESVVLRDYSDINVRDGTALIAEKNLQHVARFVKGDAFDEESVASLAPRPTIAVVSGLYELFPDNISVAASLRGLARAVETGGYLVYTGQPWHPQLELIARTLTSHRGGEAWVMRRRTQAELDQLVAQAGFRKLEQWTDDWGIFTVSLATRA
jgi:alpha-beta hydrolase superfamily lysophospholipase/SAM-dependent methyltransferase